jgi:hypothetical protein
MPRLPIDYSKTIMYKLCCLDQSINDIYVGHTTDFKNRKRGHKECCCNKNSKHSDCYVYQFIRQHGGWENWQMIQIEEYPCKNNREAHARETFWMKELKSTLNSKQSFTTEEERKQYLKEYHKTDKMKEYVKEWYETNKEKIKEQKKQYRQSEKYKEQLREYNNTDERKEYLKQWHRRKSLYLDELKCYNF